MAEATTIQHDPAFWAQFASECAAHATKTGRRREAARFKQLAEAIPALGAPANGAAPAESGSPFEHPDDHFVALAGGIRTRLYRDGRVTLDDQPAVAVLEADWEADQRELAELRARCATLTAAQAALAEAAMAIDDTSLRAIGAEVARWRAEDGWTPAQDDRHTDGELAQAAATYAFPPARRVLNGRGAPYTWPWEWTLWRPSADRERELVKAGALVVLELSRLGRARLIRGGVL